MNRSDALDAWRRGLMGDAAEPVEPEGPGALGRVMDYASRPVSGVMGGFFGALSPEVTMGEGITQGLKGERYFSAFDFLVEGGFDPDAKKTKLLGLAADVLNPADPLNYVGLGFTKAGKVARGLSKAGEGAESFGKLLSRADAAEKGLWSPLTFAGQRVLPKGVSVPVARAVDAVGNRITKSKFVEALSPYLGGVKKFEAAFPGISSMISGAKRALDVDEKSFVGELVKIEDSLLGKGLDRAAVSKVMKDVTSLLEAPETRLVRAERELELVEDALAGKFQEWLPEGLPVEEVETVTQVNFANQRAVDRRVAELQLTMGKTPSAPPVAAPQAKAGGSSPVESQIVDRYLGASGGATETRVRLADLRKGLSAEARAAQDEALLRMQREGKLVLNRLDDPQEITDADRAAALMLSPDAPRHVVYLKPSAVASDEASLGADAFQKMQDELHVLKSVQAARFAEDLPPMDVLVKRREALVGEVEHIRKLWDEAGPEVLQAYDGLRPLLKETRDLYEGVLRGYDKDFEFPVEDYLKHMFPVSYAKLPRNVLKAREAAVAERTALVEELAKQGLDDLGIERAVRERMGARAALAGVDQRGLLKGDLDAFKQREYQMSIEEFNKWAEEGGLDSRFETYSAAIASAMRRDASRWKFGHDINRFVLDKPGWTIGAEEFGKLGRAEQKAWAPMEFHVPWIDPAKNPFKDKYVRREVKDLMGAQLTGMNKLLTDDGLNGVLGVLSGFRKWWTAWSLAPFPSSRVRDLVSDMVLAHQAGLNPAVDLAKAPMGGSMYMASLALNQRRSKIPAVRGMAAASPMSLSSVLGRVQEKFPELTEEKLVEYMEIEGVLGVSAVRDLDLASVLSNDPLMKKARAERGRVSRMLDWTPLHHDVDRSPIIKAGFGVAEATANFTRGALFLDTLMKALPEAKSMDDALTYATATVRKFQFDYTDLTQVERDVLKNIIPFYTFSSKNLPLQITEAATDPGRLAWVNRLYEGAWGQFDDEEVQAEDLPDFLRDGLGMPISPIEMEDGSKGYAIWTPRGWLPQTELNEMADLIRGKAGSAIISRLNPILKEPFEQLLNRDSFTMQEIEDGTIRDVMGVPMNRRAVHLINNLRLVSEVDRMDPGGLWTKIGQEMGWWEDERPHRWTAPGPERATRFFTGLNIKGVAPTQQAERNFRDADREANAALSRARYATRRGQTLEAEGFMEEVQSQRVAGMAAMARLNELRKRNALEVAKKEAGGGRP